jgi:hypothetical protein
MIESEPTQQTGTVRQRKKMETEETKRILYAAFFSFSSLSELGQDCSQSTHPP